MCQGNNKTGQKRTDAMFVMTPANIPNIPTHQTVTYAIVLVNIFPEKEDPNQIWFTASGNLINYPGKNNGH
jgi:hypothetical protein